MILDCMQQRLDQIKKSCETLAGRPIPQTENGKKTPAPQLENELRERVIVLEVKVSTMETGLSEIYRALELHGLMSVGEAVVAKKPSVNEKVFLGLKWVEQTGSRLGPFDIAYEKDNSAERWSNAHTILKNRNASINQRFHEQNYGFSYWLWSERPSLIFRKRLTEKKENPAEQSSEHFNPNLCGVNPLKKER